MDAFCWRPCYSISVPEIDAQHRHMFGIANRLRTAMLEHRTRPALRALLDELMAYSRSHFEAEEALMIASRFPEYPQQKAAHDAFTAQMRRFVRDFESGDTDVSVALISFLGYWLCDHVMGMDRRLGSHLATAPDARSTPADRAKRPERY